MNDPRTKLLNSMLDGARIEWKRFRDPTMLLMTLEIMAPREPDPAISCVMDLAREVIDDLSKNPPRRNVKKDREIRRWQYGVKWWLEAEGIKPGDPVPAKVIDEIAQRVRKGRKTVENYIYNFRNQVRTES